MYIGREESNQPCASVCPYIRELVPQFTRYHSEILHMYFSAQAAESPHRTNHYIIQLLFKPITVMIKVFIRYSFPYKVNFIRLEGCLQQTKWLERQQNVFCQMQTICQFLDLVMHTYSCYKKCTCEGYYRFGVAEAIVLFV